MPRKIKILLREDGTFSSSKWNEKRQAYVLTPSVYALSWLAQEGAELEVVVNVQKQTPSSSPLRMVNPHISICGKAQLKTPRKNNVSFST